MQKTKVNFNKEYNTIKYIFKYTAYTGTVAINVSTKAIGDDADKLSIEKKFCYAKSLPNWDAQGYTFGNSHQLRVSSGNQNSIYISL